MDFEVKYVQKRIFYAKQKIRQSFMPQADEHGSNKLLNLT